MPSLNRCGLVSCVIAPRSASLLSLRTRRCPLAVASQPAPCPVVSGFPKSSAPLRDSSKVTIAGASSPSRFFSSAASRGDLYGALGVERNASEAEIKKAYRENALKWHPDRNPPEKRGEAEKRFSEASEAYEILSDPQKRQEYDLTGRVGGSGGGPHGGHGGGFHPGAHPFSQAEAERILREAFGGQFGGSQGRPLGMEQIMQQLLMQQQQQQQQMRQGQGCAGRRKQRGLLQADMEVRIRHDAETIHRASRMSNIGTEYDEQRARFVGKLATITKVDPSDRSVKLRVMVSPGRAAELWFGADAVWIPEDLQADEEIQISADVTTIHNSSREVGIDTENDERRARCAGKLGTVIKVDPGDQSVKARIIVSPGRADELWFGLGSLEPLPQRAQ